MILDNTLVLTPTGPVRAKELTWGDKVVGIHGEVNKIVAIERFGYNKFWPLYNFENKLVVDRPQLFYIDNAFHMIDLGMKPTFYFQFQIPFIEEGNVVGYHYCHGPHPDRVVQMDLEEYKVEWWESENPDKVTMVGFLLTGSHSIIANGVDLIMWPNEMDWDYDNWVPHTKDHTYKKIGFNGFKFQEED